MKIRVNYFIAPQETQILDFEVDEKSTLIEIAQLIKRSVQNNIMLLPVKMKGVDSSLTAKSYFQRTHLNANDVHFNALNPHAFTHEAQLLLAGLNLDLSLLPEESKEEGVTGNLESARQLIHMCQRLPKEIREALMVRVGDTIDMRGGTCRDHVSKEGNDGTARHSLQVHPYPWLAAGASNVIVHQIRLISFLLLWSITKGETGD